MHNLNDMTTAGCLEQYNTLTKFNDKQNLNKQIFRKFRKNSKLNVRHKPV